MNLCIAYAPQNELSSEAASIDTFTGHVNTHIKFIQKNKSVLKVGLNAPKAILYIL